MYVSINFKISFLIVRNWRILGVFVAMIPEFLENQETIFFRSRKLSN